MLYSNSNKGGFAMYIIVGLIRSSLLYAFALTLIHGTLSVEFAVVYAAFIFVNFLLSKLHKDSLTFGEILMETIKHDILVPFLGVRALVLILLGKYLNDPHESHAALFMSQGIVEAIWGTLLAVCIVVAIIQVV
jgi:hypothetical protein